MIENLSNDPMAILSQVLEEMKQEKGAAFVLRDVNLSELERRTGISRKKLRNLRKTDFKEKPKGRKGMKNKTTVLSGFTGVIDDLLRRDVANSEVIYGDLYGLLQRAELRTVSFCVIIPVDKYENIRLQVVRT